jgi:putative aldouronate transport system substrate-binding protein
MKRNSCRLMAMVFALLLGLSALMAGCTTAGSTSTQPTASAAAATVAPTTEATAVPTTEATVAPTATPVESANLIWYLRNDKPTNADAVIAKANELIQKEINATVDFRFVSGGDYVDKMNLIMQASEAYDICFTSSWCNDYVKNVNSGAYIPLDSYVDKYPDMKSLLSDQLWGATKIGGKIYGIPNLGHVQPGRNVLQEGPGRQI